MRNVRDHHESAGQRDQAFPPVADTRARVLILGSMPGRASLEAGQYYAHPRNAFWPIMADICGCPPDLGYEARCDALRARGIALWDVLRSCIRPGSLDSNIETDTAEVNDFGPLLGRLNKLRLIAFNGATAERLFHRRVLPKYRDALAGIDLQRLPSTSPAMASLSLQDKLRHWRALLEPVLFDEKDGPP